MSVGPFQTLRFASTVTTLLDVMIFLTVAAASLLGAFLGNLSVFWILGTMAKKVEQQQQAQLEELHKSYVDMVQKENERMRNYAKMEG